MPLANRQILNNRYNIVSLLGQGAFGAVYRAWDLNQSRACAVKENLDTSPEAQKQFGREAGLLANLSHPNLVHVTDYFFLPGLGQYFVMDFVDGKDLEQMLADGTPLPLDQVMQWIGQICDALDYLHTQEPPIIHRDIKPGNIKIDPKGKATLVDFGIARLFKTGKASDTQKMGTPGYAAPEQFGRGQTDARSDIYSLGVLLHQLLTRHEPWTTPFKLPLPRNINPTISPTIEAAIIKATQDSPADRFQTVKELHQALLSPVAAPQPAPVPAQPQKSVQTVSLPQATRSTVTAPAVVPPGYVPIPTPQPKATAAPVLPVRSPVAVRQVSKRPRAATFASWVCILTGIDLLGLVGGVAMLKGKNWGRVLGAIHVFLLLIASLTLAGFSNTTDVWSYWYGRFPFDYHYVYLSILFISLFLGITLAALYRSEVVEWFKPDQSKIGEAPRGIKILVSWYSIFVLGWPITILFGIHLLKGEKKDWWRAQFAALWGMVVGFYYFQELTDKPIGLFFGSLIILIFTWCALYLLRKDVRKEYKI